ncbi:MAG: Rhs element Vgr protein [Arenicella sp.]|jgi:Rhs element Vgr protein
MEKEGYISYVIKIGSKSYDSQGPIISVSTDFEINRIPTATIVLIDGDPNSQDFVLSVEAQFKLGTEVTISLGYKGINAEVFKGNIISSTIRSLGTRGMSLKIDCSHKTIKLTKGRKAKFFEEKTDEDIIKALFTGNGLTAKVTSTATFVAHPTFLQYDITDWDLLITRCEVNSLNVLFSGADVNIVDAKLTGTAADTYTFGLDIMEFESEVSSEEQFKKVEAHTWSSDTQKLLSSVAKKTDFEQLETGFAKAELVKAISPASVELFHGGEMPKSELDAWGKSTYTKGGVSKVRGRLKILGDNVLKLGDEVELKGLGTNYSGVVMVTGLRQEYSGQGWVTHIQFGLSARRFVAKPEVQAPAAGGLTSAMSGLQIGKVLKIDGDPQHRIQIALPVSGAETKVWARMVFEDAGNNRGRIFWPEVDDEVIVGFLNDDPRNPIILGSVYSKKNVPPIKPDAKNEERAIISKSDVRITINEKDKSIEIKTPGGNKIFVDDKGKSITLEDQHKNTIVMEKAGITIKSMGDITLDATKKINLKAKADVSIEGVNIASKAKAKFSGEGKAGAEIKTSAIAIIKGSMVKIN